MVILDMTAYRIRIEGKALRSRGISIREKGSIRTPHIHFVLCKRYYYPTIDHKLSFIINSINRYKQEGQSHRRNCISEKSHPDIYYQT